MGLIIGRFRSKKSTYDILEKLENEITSIENFGRSTELFRKKVITRFIQLAILLYCLLAFIIYFNYSTIIASSRKFVYIIPFLASPFVIWFIKKFLGWYYSKKLQRNEKKLVKLKDEKRKILDKVMETETYKVAKKILDKFGNEKKQVEVPLQAALLVRGSPVGLRQRTNVGTPLSTQVKVAKPFPQLGSAIPKPISTLDSQRFGPVVNSTPAPSETPRTLPRPVLPSHRSAFDKMLDYLVGDGPSNRYALICKKCSCHNGMAFKEEFEYFSFTCVYCSHYNPSRKKKLTGPKFGSTQNIPTDNTSNTSESDKDTSESEEKELQRTISERRRSSAELDVPKSTNDEIKTSSSSETEKKTDDELTAKVDS